MKTVKFYTLGCKVNQYDTELMREHARAAGYKDAFPGKKAGVCVINTCTVTHRADRESLYLIRRAKKENPRARIIVTGCLAQNDKDMISAVGSGLTIAENKDKQKIARLLGAAPKTRGEPGGIAHFFNHTRAFVKIQDGCDNFCSYCKVPLVRGRSRSRPLKEIVKEAGSLVAGGVKEIVLTGICLGAYGKELARQQGLETVIASLEKIEGLARIRLSSIEPENISSSLLNCIKRSKKVCRHLHIPLQSGDNTILKAMNRKYSQAGYLGLIRKIKRLLPGIAITTDVIVGFPGESGVNFVNTVEAIGKIKPLKVHLFPYSPRIGTAAARIAKSKEISEIIKKERFLRLQKVAQEYADFHIRKLLGKKVQLLVEGPAEKYPGYWQGHTDTYVRVLVKAPSITKNTFLSVIPESVVDGALMAKPVVRSRFI